MNRMRVEFHQDPAAFSRRASPLLLENEAQSCVIFGVLSRLTDPALRRPDEPMPLMAVVIDDRQKVIGAATQTMRYPIVVSCSSPDAAPALAAAIDEAGISLSGVVGPADVAESFASQWAQRTGSRCRRDVRLGVYQADHVVQPPPVAGSFRKALDADFDVLSRFAEDFFRQIGEPAADPKVDLQRAIRERRLHVWCDEAGEAVSMAAWAGPTPNGVRVNFVYTPPSLRRRGYASTCVAALTTQLLSSGRKFVFLFTDMANPISNHVYQSIGYCYLADQQKILFDAPGSA